MLLFVLVAIGALVLLGGGGLGAYFAFVDAKKQPEVAKVEAPDAGWVEFPEPRGNYRAKFPEVPVTRIQPHQGANGENFDVVVNLWESDIEWFLVAHKPVPDLKGKGLTTDYVLDEGFSNKRFRFRARSSEADSRSSTRAIRAAS